MPTHGSALFHSPLHINNRYSVAHAGCCVCSRSYIYPGFVHRAGVGPALVLGRGYTALGGGVPLSLPKPGSRLLCQLPRYQTKICLSVGRHWPHTETHFSIFCKHIHFYFWLHKVVLCWRGLSKWSYDMWTRTLKATLGKVVKSQLCGVKNTGLIQSCSCHTAIINKVCNVVITLDWSYRYSGLL